MKRLIILLFISLSLFATNANADFFSDVIVTSPDGIWTDSRAYATLNDAITAVGANDREIVIVNEQAVTTLTVPSNVRLKFLRDGSINNSGQLTINTKNISADNRQIFTGTGDIDFANGSVLRSAWFSQASTAINTTTDDIITLIISKQTSVWHSCTVGNNVILKWESPNNILTVRSGVVVSNIKNIEAGNYQLFGGPGDFDFLDGTRLKLDWFVRLRSVVTWIESEKVTLEISDNNTVSYDNTIPSNLSLRMFNGGSLSIDIGRTITSNGSLEINPGAIIDGAGTLTINGPFEAGLSQCFGTSIDIDFGDGVNNAYSQWFGTRVDATTDFTIPIQRALDSKTQKLTVKLLGLSYKTTDTITVSGSYKVLDLEGGSITSYVTDKAAVEIKPAAGITRYSGVKNGSLLGDEATGNATIGLKISGAAWFAQTENLIIKYFGLGAAGGYGFYIIGAGATNTPYFGNHKNINADQNYIGFYAAGQDIAFVLTTNHFEGCYASTNDSDGFLFRYCTGNTLTNIIAESNVGAGIHLDYTHGMYANGGFIEGNTPNLLVENIDSTKLPNILLFSGYQAVATAATYDNRPDVDISGSFNIRKMSTPIITISSGDIITLKNAPNKVIIAERYGAYAEVLLSWDGAVTWTVEYLVKGGINTAWWTVTKDTATSFNIYYDAGSSSFKLQSTRNAILSIQQLGAGS